MPYKEAKKRDLETIELWAKQDLTTQKTRKKIYHAKDIFCKSGISRANATPR